MILQSVPCYTIAMGWVATGHSPGEPEKPGKIREFKNDQGKVREKRKSQGKCVLHSNLQYGQLPRVLILIQGTVVHHMKSERRKGFSYMQVVT